MTRRKIFCAAFLLWTIMLVFLSLWPSLNKVIRQDISGFRWDYIEHFVCYFILGFLYIFWRIDQKLYISFLELILFLGAGLVFSWMTEYFQVFIPGRAFNIRDMGSNMIGITIGTLISYFIFAGILLKDFLNKKGISFK